MVEYKAWPFKEAQRIVEKLARAEEAGIPRRHEDVLFETGFGPSGLPHIGTFAEVARTTWVRYAYEQLTGQPTRLVAFSDDLDGLRKVPLNMPNPELIAQHLGKPLCDIPDPYGQEESFSGYMNAKLRSFLDSFGFAYEFKSSRDQYRGGVFNEGLERIMDCYEDVRGVILPTLGAENRENWSPFFPICQKCGKVYSTRVTGVHPHEKTISYACDQSFKGIQACGHSGTMPVTNGNVKVGWKVDWALRWYVFGVDYEMYGKDLIDSAELSAKIVRILGGDPPEGFFYELFLDENGAKISKSVGQGLTIDEWLKYGPLESLAWFIYQNPTKAKKLYFDVIPKNVDDYLDGLRKFSAGEEAGSPNVPVWFVDQDRVRAKQPVGYDSDLNFSMLLNLVNVLNTDDPRIVWNYILRYDPHARRNETIVEGMIARALTYYRDFVVPTKVYALPTPEAMPALEQFRSFLQENPEADAEALQNAAYSAGKENGLALNAWFLTLYRLLLGQERGPRIGTFVHLFGVQETLAAIELRMAQGA